jgi:dolichyl-phosphate beta-glucosyltransferase
MLIVPCYNEADRLNVKTFLQYTSDEIQFCFADDGSTDNTYELLQKSFAQQKNIRIYRAPKNFGKAGVIRAAVLDLLKSGLPYETNWVGFWDADLATPLDEVAKFFKYREEFAPWSKAMFGSRVLRLGAKIERSPLRHYLGRIFATFASLLLRVQPYDSQCGAKIFHKDLLTKAFGEAFISRWIFDLEILLRIGQESVVEVPLTKWRDIPGSKVKILKEANRVLRDLWLIRKKYLSSSN